MKVFISGGCKNGKSSFAQQLTVQLSSGKKRYYIATMIPHDEEDLDRIRRHLEDRAGMGFETLECGKNVRSCLTDSVDRSGAFLLDSVTALLQNEMYPENFWEIDAEEAAQNCRQSIIDFVSQVENAVIVSDFIYADAERYDPSTEQYRRNLAAIDRAMAAMCDVVLEMSGGNLICHKGELPV